MDAPAPKPRPWPTHRRFSVPYHDIDAMNHLNHAAYFPMMETLRCDYYLPLLGTRDPTDLDSIVAEATCCYLAPVLYGAELVGEVVPARSLGTTSFTLLYRFRDASTDRVVARGRTVLVTYDYRTGTKRPIPDARRQRFEADAIDPTTEGWNG